MSLIFPLSFKDNLYDIYCVKLSSNNELIKILTYLIKYHSIPFEVNVSTVYSYYNYLNSIIIKDSSRISFEMPTKTINLTILESIPSNLSLIIELTKDEIEEKFFKKKIFKKYFHEY